MSTIGAVQRRIKKVEGFEVRFKYPHNRKDVYDNKIGLPQYPYTVMARNVWNVTGWKNQRFKPNYPGFDVVAYFKDGTACNGNCRLANIRDSYL
jgi:hypothetical protein